MSATDRKGPFLVGSHTEKATVLFCCVGEGFGPRLLSAAVEPHCGAGEAILSRWRAGAKHEAKPRERGLSSHGPLFWRGEKDYCRTHRVKNASKSAGSVARIERAKG